MPMHNVHFHKQGPEKGDTVQAEEIIFFCSILRAKTVMIVIFI